ncbi:MAG: hypothetical protein AAGF35_05610, partial [Pseudomonadota bacterium]
LVLFVGSLLLIVPGIILGVSLFFGPYLVVTDELGPIAALRRSHKLVWGDWWRTTIILTVVIFILMAVYVLAGILGAFAGYSETESPSVTFYTIEAIVGIVISAILTPIFPAFGLAVLNDLKLRKEGDDLSARLDALDNA